MSNIQFQLVGNTRDVASQEDLMAIINSHSSIINIVYKPNKLENRNYSKLKIANKSFRNVSFSKTELLNIDFTNCHFEDSLLMGTVINGCDFQNCSFKNVNTHKIEITKSYINPKSFENNYRGAAISNLGVHLFQQLFNNSQDSGQKEFATIANYNFLKWKGILTYNKFKNKQPYPISFVDFLRDYIPNFFYRFTFGYGLRLRNFLISFSFVFGVFYLINLYYWNRYILVTKGLKIESFQSNKANLTANLFYTIDVTTKIIDSQFQPSSVFGMYMLTLQGIVGFIFFTLLITILINKFVK